MTSLRLLASSLVAIALGHAAASVLGQSPQQIAKTAFAKVVLISTQDAAGRPLALGSGFFVRPGLVATNLHVIAGASKGHVKLVGQPTSMTIEGTAAVDANHDLVLLRVGGLSPPPMPLAAEVPDVGETIYAIGNPVGLEGTFSQGIVSGIRDLGDVQLIQITAPISPGSSGGPVLNSRGEVVGVAVATLEGGQNVNFAIPARDLVGLLSAPISNTTLAEAANTKRHSSATLPGRPSTDAVSVSSFLWDGTTPGATLGSDGRFSISLKNDSTSSVRRIAVLIVFYDKDGAAIDSAEVNFLGEIGPGVAKRAAGAVDPSVKASTTPLSRQNQFMYATQPNTRLEYRVLSFELVR